VALAVTHIGSLGSKFCGQKLSELTKSTNGLGLGSGGVS